jgi:antitoxin HicB
MAMGPILYAYPATLTRDEDGRLLVLFPDLPETGTDGADEKEALDEASDCLSEALAARISDGEDIPRPSRVQPNQFEVTPSLRIALKAALHTVIREEKYTLADVARAMKIDHKEARRLLDPKESTKEARLEEALEALGYRSAFALYDPGKHGRVLGVAGERRRVPTLRRTPRIEPKKGAA